MSGTNFNEKKFASRGGLKLEFALEKFGISPSGLVAADLGSSTGGFVDALLQAGAKKVYAVEKGKGVLDWKLRNDSRVKVMEGVDAKTVRFPEQVDLVTADLGFTRQKEFLPNLVEQLKPTGKIISLIKPQYEASGRELVKGRLTDEVAQQVLARTLENIKKISLQTSRPILSPIAGKARGAKEYFVLLTL